jgi:hypothetical protein
VQTSALPICGVGVGELRNLVRINEPFLCRSPSAR